MLHVSRGMSEVSVPVAIPASVTEFGPAASIEKAVPSKKTLPTHKSLREGGRAQERVSLSDKECKGVVVGRTKFVF